jgi:hypothetical protein
LADKKTGHEKLPNLPTSYRVLWTVVSGEVNLDKLFAVYLGGKCQGAMIEVHDIAFVSGLNIKATFPKLREHWFGKKSTAHVDSWVELAQIDGYDIFLTKTARIKKNEPALYFVNIGFYNADVFGEGHRFYFMVCETKLDAKKRAKQLFSKQTYLPHIDNLNEVDNLIRLTEVGGYRIGLRRSTELTGLKIHNVYWPLRSRDEGPDESIL